MDFLGVASWKRWKRWKKGYGAKAVFLMSGKCGINRTESLA